MDASCIPHLCCPKCGSHIDARSACPQCDWTRGAIGLRVIGTEHSDKPLWTSLPKPGAPPRPPPMGDPAVWRGDNAIFALYTLGHRRRSRGEHGALRLVNLGTGEAEDVAIPPEASADCSNAVSGVTVDGDLAFFGDETGRVHGFDLRRRAFRWSTPLGDDALEARPVVHDGALLATTARGQIAVLNPATGALGPVMLVPGGPRLASPLLPVNAQAGYVSAHISDTHGAVFAVDLARASVHPRPLFETAAPIYTRPALLRGRVWVATHAAGAPARSELIAFDLKTGRNGMRPIAGLQAVRATPLADGERLFFGDRGRNLYCVNAATLQIEPGFPKSLPHSAVLPMALANDLIFAASSHGDLVAIDVRTGAEVWRHRAAGDGHVLSPPLAVDGVIVCPTPSGELFALPYHYSQWEWAQQQAARNARWAAAAAFARRRGGPRAPQNAAQVLSDAGRHADAAFVLRDALPPDYDGAGREFELAARDASDRAGMLDQAAACYTLNKEWPDARRCLREAARARGSPFLSFSLAAVRGLKVGDEGVIEFSLLNEAPVEAREVALHLESDALASSKAPGNKPQLKPNHAWREQFSGVRMARSGLQLIDVKANFADIAGTRYQQTFSFELPVSAEDRPATIINTQAVNVAEKMVLVSGDVGFIDNKSPAGEAAPPPRAAGARIRLGGDLGSGVVGPGDDLEVGGSAGYVKVVHPRDAEARRAGPAPGRGAEGRVLAALGAKDQPPAPIGFRATPHTRGTLYCVDDEFDIDITAQTSHGPRAVRLTLRCLPGSEAVFLSRCGRGRDAVTDTDVRDALELWARRACAS